MANINKDRNELGFEWPVVVKNSNPHASLDYYYGPYDSVESMKAGVPTVVLVPGFTAAVQDDSGVTEYWVVSGAGESAIWQQKGVSTGDMLTLKGTKQTLEEVEALTDMAVGDMWLVPVSSSESAEYVWTGSAWEKMGEVSSIAHCTLTLKGASFSVDGVATTTPSFNNTQNVTLDLSNFATSDKLDELEDSIGDGCLRIKWTTDSDVEEQDLFTANQGADVTLDLSKFPLIKDGIPEAWKTAIQIMIKQALDGYVYQGHGTALSVTRYDSIDDAMDYDPLEVYIESGKVTAEAFYEKE